MGPWLATAALFLVGFGGAAAIRLLGETIFHLSNYSLSLEAGNTDAVAPLQLPWTQWRHRWWLWELEPLVCFLRDALSLCFTGH